MANRNNRPMGNRRMDYNRMDNRMDNRGNKGLLPRPMSQVSPWQQSHQNLPLNNILPITNSSEATLVLANNLINNLLQARQSTVPSLLDVPVQRNFPNQDFNRGMNRMGNQPNFRRGPGNFSNPMPPRPINRNIKNFRPLETNKRQPYNQRRDDPKFKNKQSFSPAKKLTPKKEPEVKQECEVKEEGEDAEMKAADGTGNTDASDTAKTSEPNKPAKKSAKEEHKTSYDDIPAALLHCHICNKGMWDGRSFDNHINGLAHHMMMEKTSESYALTADTIRQELKIQEMKSSRRAGKPLPKKFYCPMCDLHATDGASHRNSAGHRKLKKFLHPACGVCGKEMATRIDLDEHKLSVEHLRMLQSKSGVELMNKPQNMTVSTLVDEMGYVHVERKGRRGEEARPEPEEEPNAILDVVEGQNPDELAHRPLPRYSTTRGVGDSFVKEMSIYECRLCNKYLDSAETVEVHLKTWRHYKLFTKHLEKLRGKKRSSGTDEKREQEEGESQAKRVKLEGSEDANGDQNALTEDVEMTAYPQEENGEGEEILEEEAAEGQEWEKDIDQLIDDIPDTEQDEEKNTEVKAEPPQEASPVTPKARSQDSADQTPPAVDSPSRRGRGARGGRARGRGGRR